MVLRMSLATSCAYSPLVEASNLAMRAILLLPASAGKALCSRSFKLAATI